MIGLVHAIFLCSYWEITCAKLPNASSDLLVCMGLVLNKKYGFSCISSHAGPLPASWASLGALPSLSSLVLSANNLSGSLPPEWGANGTSLTRLRKLDLRQNGLSGYLPDLWGAGFKVIQLCPLPCVPTEDKPSAIHGPWGLRGLLWIISWQAELPRRALLAELSGDFFA